MQLQNLLEILLIPTRKVPNDGDPPAFGELEHEVVPFSHLLSGQIAAKWVVFVGVGTRLIKQFFNMPKQRSQTSTAGSRKKPTAKPHPSPSDLPFASWTIERHTDWPGAYWSSDLPEIFAQALTGLLGNLLLWVVHWTWNLCFTAMDALITFAVLLRGRVIKYLESLGAVLDALGLLRPWPADGSRNYRDSFWNWDQPISKTIDCPASVLFERGACNHAVGNQYPTRGMIDPMVLNPVFSASVQ